MGQPAPAESDAGDRWVPRQLQVLPKVWRRSLRAVALCHVGRLIGRRRSARLLRKNELVRVIKLKDRITPHAMFFPNVHTHAPCAPCMDAITEHPDATASPKCCACHDFTTASPKCCACHDFAHPPPRARQHPVPLDSCRTQPLPHKHTPRCCACHDFGNGIAKVLRLPRFRNGIAKVLRLPRFRTPPAARVTTSCPSRQLPNATPATQTHTQMHRMLRLPRLRQRHRQSAAPATISNTPRRARDNILSL